jgi:hypothetical protein
MGTPTLSSNTSKNSSKPASTPSNPRSNEREAVRENQALIKKLRDALEAIFDHPLKAAPGKELNPVKKTFKQLNPKNHCGELSQDFIDAITDAVFNLKFKTCSLYLEVQGGRGLGSQNHARVLIGTDKGIIVCDPWKGSIEYFPLQKGRQSICIESDLSSTGGHLYSLDTRTGDIKVLSSSDSFDNNHVYLESRGQSNPRGRK